MSNFIYPNIRINPEYKFDEVLSGYNYNFTLLENVVPSSSTTFNNLTVTGNTTLNELTASTIYSGSTNLYDIFSVNDFYTTGVTLSGNSLVFDRNDSLSAFTVDLSSLSYLPLTGGKLVGSLTAGTVVLGDNTYNGSFKVQAATLSPWFTVNNGEIRFNEAGGVTRAGNQNLNCRFNIGPVSDSLPALGIRGAGAGTSDLIRVNSLTATTGDYFLIKGDGKIGINKISPSASLHVGGNVIIDTVNSTSSNFKNLVLGNNGEIMYSNYFDISINFIDIETWNYRAPEDFKIHNIINPDGLNLTIDVNSSGYTTGDTIVYLDTLEITPDAAGFIKLNCEKI